jgi:hypothetical protein
LVLRALQDHKEILDHRDLREIQVLKVQREVKDHRAQLVHKVRKVLLIAER